MGTRPSDTVNDENIINTASGWNQHVAGQPVGVAEYCGSSESKPSRGRWLAAPPQDACDTISSMVHVPFPSSRSLRGSDGATNLVDGAAANETPGDDLMLR